jgi:hypothetical protein
MQLLRSQGNRFPFCALCAFLRLLDFLLRYLRKSVFIRGSFCGFAALGEIFVSIRVHSRLRFFLRGYSTSGKARKYCTGNSTWTFRT